MFDVGERVVCVDNKKRGGPVGDDNFCDMLEVGRQYTIKAARRFYGKYDAVLLEETGKGNRGFHASRFRPLRKLDTSESLKALKQLAVDCPADLAQVG